MSLDDRLDAVLRRAREPEPADDGFTDTVMARVRGGTNRRWRRYLTRPAILAAAAVLMAGGAFAAVRQAAPEAETQATAETPVADVRAEAGTDAASPPPEKSPPARETTSGTSSETDDEQPVHREGGYEWGYTSEHTSYVLHLDSGLRLETETHTNSFAVDEPHEVTLTLENTSDDPVGVAAEDRCPLVAFAGRADRGEGEDPSILPDPTAERSSEAKVHNCAREGGNEQPSGEPERFVLGPGESHVERSVVVLPERGDWAIAAHCRCRWTTLEETSESRPTPTPERDDGLLPLRSGTSPDDGQKDEPSKDRDPYRSYERSGHFHGPDPRFMTPPIRVEAS